MTLFQLGELFEQVGFEKSRNASQKITRSSKTERQRDARFNDKVDFSRYEDGIRQLLNTYAMRGRCKDPD